MEEYRDIIEKRSWVEIDLQQIRKNLEIYKKNLPDSAEIIAVIKADAYGHGDLRIAKLLDDCKISAFAVSNIDEAVRLRKNGIRSEIMVLGYTDPKFSSLLKRENIIQTLVSEEHAYRFIQNGVKIRCQFAIDTGMNRIGLDGDDVDKCVDIIKKYSNSLEIVGAFTHLSVADSMLDDDIRFTSEQIRKFNAIVEKLQEFNFKFIHCCNSAGGLYCAECQPDIFNTAKFVRLGIILYGLKPNEHECIPQGILPVLTWKSTISMVKKVCRGEFIGYGRTFKAENDMVCATVTTGYADGYSRAFSNLGFVLVHGKKARIVGRICMDQMMVDVTGIADPCAGDEVVLIGYSGNGYLGADEIAKKIGTIGYEIVCNISKRVPRIYVDND